MPLLGSPPVFGVFLFLFFLGPHTFLSILFLCFIDEETKIPGHTGSPCWRHEWNSSCLAAKLKAVTYMPTPHRLSPLRTEGGFAQDFSQEVLDMPPQYNLKFSGWKCYPGVISLPSPTSQRHESAPSWPREGWVAGRLQWGSTKSLDRP